MKVNFFSKKCLFVLPCLLIYNNVFSQTKSFNAGFDLGMVSSQISGDDLYGFSQFGLSGSVFTTYHLAENWSTTIHLTWNPKGARNYSSAGNANIYKLRVNYVDIPIWLAYHVSHFRIFAGPSINVYVNHRETFNNSPVPVNRDFDRLEIALNLGLSYSFKEKWLISTYFANSTIPVRNHLNPNVFPSPPLVLGNFHRSLLNKGQYLTYLGLKISYFFKPL